MYYFFETTLMAADGIWVNVLLRGLPFHKDTAPLCHSVAVYPKFGDLVNPK
jgi:hypothetical protein